MEQARWPPASVMCGSNQPNRPKHAAADRCLQLDAKPVCGDKLVKQVENAAQLVQSINALGNAWE